MLFVASRCIGIDHFVGLLCITFKSYLPFWAYSLMPAMLIFGFVAQNDGPMADTEKIMKIGAAYYAKVVDASFPYFHGTLNLLFFEVIN